MKLLIYIVLIGILSLGATAFSIDSNTAGEVPEWYSSYLTIGDEENLNGDYSNTENWGRFEASNGTYIRIHRMLIALVDNGITNADVYGGLAQPLPRGISFWLNQSGDLRRLDSGLNTTRNWEFHRLAYDVDEESQSFGSGEDTIAIRWTFSNAGVPLRLNGTAGDSILVKLNDDFTGIDGHYFKIQGYNETVNSIAVTTSEEKDMTTNISIALIFLGMISVIILYGFTIKDKTLKEVEEGGKLMVKEITNPLLTMLKILYLMVVPALVLLGLHIAREMAIDQGVAVNVTDALNTAFQVMSGLYLFTLVVFFILIFKNVIMVFIGFPQHSLDKFKNKRGKF